MELDQDRKRSQSDLEWPDLLERVSQYAVSDGGRRRVRELCPAGDADTASLRQTTLGEALLLLATGHPLPVRAVSAVSDAVMRAEKGGVLSGEELWQVGRVLDAALDLGRFGRVHAEVGPNLARVLEVEGGLGELAQSISSKIEEGGRVLDRASVGLREARREVFDLSRRVKRQLDELILRHRDALQDAYFAEREGRFVLPVRSDAPYRVEGSVLGSSASGATLYIEPRELSPLMNQLRLAEDRQQREEEAVRRALSEEIVPVAADILGAGEVCELGDFFAACARFSEKIQARVAPFSTDGSVRLRGARHPILAANGHVVPFDGELGPGRGLIVSGPNAGGKTVALKTLGLFALMQASGLPLPVEQGSVVPFFELVLSDIGDDQSLSRSLSTFSGHVERVRRMLEAADANTLILFDELMAGTDPMEGAALAVALAERFVSEGASLVVTTHYEALKSLAEKDARFTNAAVGFDFHNMRPTFEVHFGRAAGSSALIVAERHGLAHDLTTRARELLPEIAVRIEQDRQAAEALLVAASEQKKALQSEIERQRLITQNLEREQERLREARRRALEDETDTMRVSLREARRELDRRRAELKSAGAGDLGQIDREFDKLAATVALGSDVDRTVRQAKSAAPLRELAVGARVRIVSLGLEGDILDLPTKGPVRVLAGGLKLFVTREDLATPSAGANRKSSQNAGQLRVRIPTAPTLEAPLRTDDVTLDLRGQRVEAGLGDLDSFIDNLLLRREPGGYVLHGHGTGAMKEAVRAHVAGHPAIVSSRPAERGEGGDAFTVVWVGPR